MSTALGLAMQISANTAQLAQAVADVNSKLDSMGQAGKKAAADLNTIKLVEIGELALGGIKLATNAFLDLGSSVTSAVQGVTKFALGVGQQLDNLRTVSIRTGIGVEALQAYANAATNTGVSVDSFVRQIQTLSTNIGKATLDENARKQFEQLGLVFRDFKELAPEQQFETIVDAISRIADPAERAAQAVKFFGKGGIELGALFTEGPGALQRMRQEAIDLGQIVDKDAVDAINKMNGAFAKVWRTVEGIVGTVLGELAGPISSLAEELLGVVKAAGPKQIAENIAAGLLDFIKLAGDAFFKLAKFIEEFVKKYGPILGLDLRDDSQKQRDALLAERNQVQKILTSSANTVVSRIANGLPATEQAYSDALQNARRRVSEIDTALAALGPESDSSLSQFAANFNQAIDAAAARVNEKLVASRESDDARRVQEEQLAELRKLTRNGEIGIVEILN